MVSLVLLIFFFLFSAAFAGENQDNQDKYKWTPADTALQTSFLFLLVIDWQQTREFTSNRDKYPDKYESNPLMSAHPSAREVNLVIAASALVHTTTAYFLPRPYRTVWQSFWIGVEAGAVLSNCVAGISLRF